MPIIKTCTNCHIKKPESDFFLRDLASNVRHSSCKSCYGRKRLTYAESHYKRYGDEYRARALIRKKLIKERLQELLIEYLRDKSCEMCGFDDIRALDFDHIDPASKNFGIARAISNGCAWNKILLEIEKCRILCANCHRIRTAKQYNWRKWRLGGAVTQRSAKP